VVVKFEAVDTTIYSEWRYQHALVVSGTLDLQSTPTQKIVFTSSRDDAYGGDSNNDGDASDPGLGNWGAIKYYNPNNVLHDAIVRFGGLDRTYDNTAFYDSQMLWILGSGTGTLEVWNCVLEHAYQTAIYAESSQTPWIHDNVVRYSQYGILLANEGSLEINTVTNTTWGVYLAGTGSPTITGNTLTGNTYPIYQGASDPVYSENDFSGNTNSAIAVGGRLSNGAVWENVEGIPYLLISDVVVPSDEALAIEGGTVVKFNSGQKLTVQGTYIDSDATANPVVFTSYRDDSYGGDTNGDGPTSGGRGDWAGIYFTTNNNTFEHTVVRYAGVNVSGPTVAMRHLTFDTTPDPAVRIQSGGGGHDDPLLQFPELERRWRPERHSQRH